MFTKVIKIQILNFTNFYQLIFTKVICETAKIEFLVNIYTNGPCSRRKQFHPNVSETSIHRVFPIFRHFVYLGLRLTPCVVHFCFQYFFFFFFWFKLGKKMLEVLKMLYIKKFIMYSYSALKMV